MPRLLLVDDNPSIHKIAESLLSGSDVHVVCVEGGAEALALVARGEVFDAALIDIFMAGMDGWALLDALRMHPATAAMPVAMMAGVLDSVDPRRLEQARVQGYVKKPVELRDLPERVRTIIASGGPSSENEPTVAMVSPFATAPAMAVRDFSPLAPSDLPEDLLVLTAEDLLEPEAPPADEAEGSLPMEDMPIPATVGQEMLPATEPVLELEPDLEWEGEGLLDEGIVSELSLEEEPEAPATAPTTSEAILPEDLASESLSVESFGAPEAEPLSEEPFVASEADLPVAAPDVLPTPEVLPTSAAMVLDDLDLDGPPAEPAGVSEPEAAVAELPAAAPAADQAPEGLETLPEPVIPETLSTPLELESLEDSVELPDLGPSAELYTPHDILEAPEEAPQAALPKDWDDSEELLSAIQAALPTALVPGPDEPMPEQPPTGELISPQLELGVGAAMAAGAAAAAAAEPGAAPSPVAGSADALVDAILADPVALEKLAKALSKHLSQAALRDVAWEVMPDLADRLRPY